MSNGVVVPAPSGAIGRGNSWDGWAQRLAAAPPTADLTPDHARPPTASGTRHTVDRLVDVDSPAFTDDTTFSDLVVAAWALLLARASGESTVVVADHDGTHRRGLLLDVSTEPHATFAALVEHVASRRRHERTRGAVEYAELASALGLSNVTDRNPLCSTAAGPLAPDLGHSAQTDGLVRPHIDVAWDDEAVCVTVSASADLFRRDRIDRLADQLARVLESGAASPQTALRNLDWVGADEHSAIERWQGPITPPGNPSLGHRFSAAARHTSETTAVTHGERSWTYAELDAWSNRLAHRLRADDIGPGSTVAIRMERCVELVGSVLAVLKCGAAYVPVDPQYPTDRQRFMLADADADAALTTSSTPALDHGGLDPLVVDLIDATPDDPDDSHPPAPLGDGSQLGYVIYTSGSTGTPKGVALGTSALANLIDWQLAQPDFTPGRTVLQFASISFDVSFQEIMSTLLSGGTLLLVDDIERRDPVALTRLLARQHVQRIFVPFVALRSLAQVASSADAETLALTEVYTAGEQLRIDDAVRSFFAAMPDCSLHNQYGPSETHVVTSHRLVGDPAGWPSMPPIGTPIANTRVEVLDPDGARLPIGMPGELWIGGRSLADGYLGRPDLTAASFVTDKLVDGDRLYRSGDLVRWNESGALEFLGRADRQAKFRGFRIEPGEISNVLANHPGVADAFVDIRDIDRVGARLVAYVVRTDTAVSLAEIRAAAAERLPDFMVPTHFVDLEHMPLTSSGKVDGRALNTPEFDRSSLTTELVAPRNAVEDAIVEMWQALLGMTQIGVLDDFFDLGGDSLIAVELFSMLRDRFHVDLPLGALVSDPTVQALARQVERGNDGAADFDVIVPIRTAGTRVPLFCVHGGSGNVASFPRLARALDDDQPFYGLQWPGFVSGDAPRSVEALAVDYIGAVKRIQPVGPYRLAGQCIGGLIANEMARQLRERGDDVDLVVMYDSPMLYSPAYRPSASAPTIPKPLRPLATRALSTAVAAIRFAKGVEPRTQIARVRALGAARRPVPYPDRFAHAAVVMTAIAWRHQPPSVDVDTVLIHSGESNAAMLAFTGVWTDGVLGWAHRLGGRLREFQVPGGHNDLLYSPEAVELLRGLLAAAD